MPLSETQMKYLALAWQCFESEPKIDYDKFHQIAGLASAHSARELMRVTKNKLREEYGALSGDMKSKNSATSTPKKKGGEEGGVAKTPASSRKKGTAKKRGKADMDDDEAAVEESATKKTKVKSEPNGSVEGEEGDELV